MGGWAVKPPAWPLPQIKITWPVPVLLRRVVRVIGSFIYSGWSPPSRVGSRRVGWRCWRRSSPMTIRRDRRSWSAGAGQFLFGGALSGPFVF